MQPTKIYFHFFSKEKLITNRNTLTPRGCLFWSDYSNINKLNIQVINFLCNYVFVIWWLKGYREFHASDFSYA